MTNITTEELWTLQRTIQHLPAALRTAIREQTPLTETQQAALLLEISRPTFEGKKQQRTISDAAQRLRERPEAQKVLTTSIDYLLGCNIERIANEQQLSEGEAYVKTIILNTPQNIILPVETGQYLAEIYQTLFGAYHEHHERYIHHVKDTSLTNLTTGLRERWKTWETRRNYGAWAYAYATAPDTKKRNLARELATLLKFEEKQ
ncbi:MAG: hypothetical protein Q7R96_03085 [Nanoarchaeota archaeon]|nr:hypothetical protein [Nanoarchaeota archaeon]